MTKDTETAIAARGTDAYALGTMTRRLANIYGDREALVEGSDRVSFEALHARVERLARALAVAGVERGDRVAALMLDSVALVELYFATAKLGAMIVPLNWRLAANELTYIVGDAAPKAFFVHERFRDLAREAAPQLTAVEVSEEDHLRAGGLATFLESQVPDLEHQESLGDTPWILLYTSGTTGKPKGCMLSQGGWVHQALSMGHRLGLTPSDCLILTAPLFHSGGAGQLLSHLLAGARIVIPPRGAGARELRAIWSSEGCTHVSPPPTLYEELCRLQREEPLPLSIRLFTMAASMNPPELVQKIMDTFAARTIHGFGQTEVCGFAAFLFGDEQVQRPTALGQAMFSIEACVVDDQGRSLPADTPGELWIRSPSVMLGYWGLDDATESALAGGWLRTGDIVRIDTDGYWHFVSRKKELIKTLGENVYPAEVEHCLLANPAVLECSVFGVPDPKYVEAVKAVIAVRPGHTLSASDVTTWCKERLAGYKRPRFIEFLPELPRSPIGKIFTSALRERPTTADQSAP
jgi:fatty-acyl-CoA synthase